MSFTFGGNGTWISFALAELFTIVFIQSSKHEAMGNTMDFSLTSIMVAAYLGTQ